MSIQDKQLIFPNKRHLLAIFFILFICTTFQGKADSNLSQKLKDIEQTINKSPWLSYQKLLEIEKSNGTLPKQTYLLLLVRKAQAENLLYFFKQFENTVKDAQQLVVEETATNIKSTLHIYAGLAERRNGRYKLAIIQFKKAMKLHKDRRQSPNYIIAKQELAYSHSLVGVFQTALDELLDTKLLASKLNDPFVLAITLETYGAVYGYLNKYQESIDYYQQALNAYQKLEYVPYQAEAIYGLASTYRYWEKYDLAIEYFEKFNELVSYIPDDRVEFYGNYGLGMSNAEKGNCSTALKIIELALSQPGMLDYKAELYKRKASCHIKLREFELAQKAISQATKIFKQLPDLIGTDWELETLKIRAQLIFEQGDTALAYQLMNEYHTKNAQLISNDSDDRIRSIRSTYEMERKDAQIELLQQQAQLQNLKSEKHQQDALFQRYLLAFLFTIIVIVLTAFLFQRRYTKRVIAISIRDSLSGLFNRRYTFQVLNKLMSSLSEHKGQLSIILLDIDNFKQINDQYGHPYGDQVIRMIAEICQSSLRAEDVMGRIGGEEFLCVLPRTSISSCKKIAERMLTQVEKYPFCDQSKKVFHTTISIGVANASSSKVSTDTLILQADKALYHSKHAGKNQVTNYCDIDE